MTPHIGEIPFSSVPPPFLSLSWTLEGLFELVQRPLRTLDLPCALLQELQRICKSYTFMYARLGAEGPGQRLLQLTQTLNVCLLKTHVFSENLGGPWLPLVC